MKIKTMVIAAAILLTVISCRTVGKAPEPEMSFEEAKGVVLSMQGIPMEPPPRKMNDILAILETSRDTGSDHLDDLIERADMPPPDQRSPKDLYRFYKSRGNARFELSRFKGCRADIRTAIAYDEQVKIGDGTLYQKLAVLEMLAGNYETALDLNKTAIKTGPYQIKRTENVYKMSRWRIGPYLAFQSRIHQRMGNFFRANMAIKNATAAYRKIPAASRLSLIVDGGVMDMGNENDILAAEAEMLEAQGRYYRAHELRARLLNYHYSKRKQKPLGSIHAQMAMAVNLMNQGRPILAEKEARTAVMDAVRISGKYSGAAADAVQVLCEIILAKGDLQNADVLSTAQIDILTRLGLAVDEDIMMRSHLLKARVNVLKEDFSTAMIAYDLAIKGMMDNPYFFRRYANRNLGLVLCLIKNNRVSEAEDLIRQTKRVNRQFRASSDLDKAQTEALDAMVSYHNHRTSDALHRFSGAVPDLVAIIQDPNHAFEKQSLAGILLRIYIDILLQLYDQSDYRTYGIDVPEELFKLADTHPSRANSALSESCIRAASLKDPALAKLVRQEQDTGKQIESLKAVLYNASAASTSGGSLDALERSIISLSRARAAFITRIEEAFPKYSNYVQPSPPSIARVQAKLVPGEALIAIWTLKDKTCVWAIPENGAFAFAVVNMGRQSIKEKVQLLRMALKHNANWLNQIPDYDVSTAYSLYESLLAPVLPAWRGATDLLTVVRGPLDQIPLAALTTKPTKTKHADALRFERYRNAPWLIRKASTTRLPSAAVLITLRNLPEPGTNRQPFAGFGDPVFNPKQSRIPYTTATPLSRRGSDGVQIAIRGIRVCDMGGLDSADVTSASLENLHRLPDTAVEIQVIASILGADKSRDIFLGQDASETNVKVRDLSSKKVVSFATHALLAGDLDGLNQPALAFSSPEVTGLDEDGLLTVGEILTLTLDADLVILSACDTGAGGGAGSEALSGLGQAFFYAGARSLLVTMWPVETTSARKLTTGLFRFQQEKPDLSRARALQKSIVDLMDNETLKDPVSGKAAAAYAHPTFWAPFIIVGDSGA